MEMLVFLPIPRRSLDGFPLVLKLFVKFEVEGQLEMVHPPLKNPGGRRDVVTRRPPILRLQTPLLLLQVLAQVILKKTHLTYRGDN